FGAAPAPDAPNSAANAIATAAIAPHGPRVRANAFSNDATCPPVELKSRGTRRARRCKSVPDAAARTARSAIHLHAAICSNRHRLARAVRKLSPSPCHKEFVMHASLKHAGPATAVALAVSIAFAAAPAADKG